MALELPERTHHDLVLELSTSAFDDAPPQAREAWQRTQTAWHERVPQLDVPVARRDAKHAYAVLSGLTSATGGMVAAATTSLPERAPRPLLSGSV